MAFVKRDVKDRVVQYPRRYQMVEVQPGIFDLIPVPGTITEPGTAINKAYLQPIEDGLADALEKTGDGKDVIVTFTEAATESHIASGEKLSTIFGKILKKFKNVAPTNHASSDTSYGLGTTTNYGHVKVRNDLIGTEISGVTVSPAQIKTLNDSVKYELVRTVPITFNANRGGFQNAVLSMSDFNADYDDFLFILRGTIGVTNNVTATRQLEFQISESDSGGNPRIQLSSIGVSSSDPFTTQSYFHQSSYQVTTKTTSKVSLNVLNLKNQLYFVVVKDATSNSIVATGTIYLDIYRKKIYK